MIDPNVAFISIAQLALVPLVIGLIEILKGVNLAGSEGRFAPIYSIALGVGGAFLLPSDTWQYTLLAGVAIALAASGAYSIGKKAIVG